MPFLRTVTTKKSLSSMNHLVAKKEGKRNEEYLSHSVLKITHWVVFTHSEYFEQKAVRETDRKS